MTEHGKTTGERPPLSRDDFELWLFDMDDALEAFAGLLPESVALDHSAASLDALETWLLQTYPSVDQLLSPKSEAVLDGAARYVGETFRKRVGGGWDIVLDDPEFVYGRLPIVRLPNKVGVPLCPHHQVRLAVKRRSGGLFSSALANAERDAKEVG